MLGKYLGRRLQFIEELIAADPKCAIAIFEERVDVHSTETVEIRRIMNEYLEVVNAQQFVHFRQGQQRLGCRTISTGTLRTRLLVRARGTVGERL